MMIRHVRGKTYAGIRITAGPVLRNPESAPLHLDRAFYLAAALEAPRWGAVQSFDGAGISGGPFHFVAMYPKSGEQGSLWALLRRLELGQPAVPLEPLWAALRKVGWFVARDGKLRDWNTGGLISGHAVRNELAPPEGRVPVRGPERQKAERWAKLFFDVLSHPHGFDAQREFSIEWLMQDPGHQEQRAYLRLGPPHGLVPGVSLSFELDLALACFHAFGVNAPAVARTRLKRALDGWDKHGDEVLFARQLVWYLGTADYGNWKVRYARTRRTAQQTRFWPDSSFVGDAAIMPATLGATLPRAVRAPVTEARLVVGRLRDRSRSLSRTRMTSGLNRT